METQSVPSKIPSDWYDEKSFFTLGGASGAVLLTCWVINYVVPNLPPEAFRYFALVLSEIFAIIIMMQTKRARKPIRWLFAFLNGLLVFVNSSGINAMTADTSARKVEKDSTTTYISPPVSHYEIQLASIFPIPHMVNWWPDEKLIAQNEALTKDSDTLQVTNRRLQIIAESVSSNSSSNIHKMDSMQAKIEALQLQLAEKDGQIDRLTSSQAQGTSLQTQLSECVKIRNIKSDSLIACLSENRKLNAQYARLQAVLTQCTNDKSECNAKVEALNKQTLTDHLRGACTVNPKALYQKPGTKKTQDQYLMEQQFWKSFCESFNAWNRKIE